VDFMLEGRVEWMESDSFRIMKIVIPFIFTLRIDAIVTCLIEHTPGSLPFNPSFTETMSDSRAIAIYPLRIMIWPIFASTTIAIPLGWFSCLKILFTPMILFSLSFFHSTLTSLLEKFHNPEMFR
jgi:hypothetical protein